MSEGEDKSVSSTSLSAKQKNDEGHVKESDKIAITMSSNARDGVFGLAPCHVQR